ncbi:[protein-PII] uridylyltransferase [Labrys monachus]|uniref:Bifunctional uridylyltransferase/uridylyl-removing enzyme n=1 Tax=Labrys monachus TaxID=217067 RepID=A0ABU0FPF2_9HYPH|nr:[protein-PII] uridylyltransferase [Labrys monachus]MDQ0395943.1 [protein-PII] uridylyltransferase [Labrys monachus]
MLDKPDRELHLVIDRMALEAEIDALALEHEGERDALRLAVVALLKTTLREGRERIKAWFHEDRLGTVCAQRLSWLEDELIRATYAYVTRYVYTTHNPTSGERMAIIAVGGYGRGTLAPGSDIDLLFLLPAKQTAWGESVTEAILYVLWDLGQKVGHATRSIDDCLRLARTDMTIRTTLLEARPILGDMSLAGDLAARFDKEIVQSTAAEFVAAKLAERDERIVKTGNSRYRVEPNVKEGKGGLRDLNTLYWIAKYVYRVRDAAALVDAGLFTRREYRQFVLAEDFLWATRCAIHFLAGRPDDRLTFDLQQDIATLLGYADRGGLRGVERFMKHYFLVAKDVGDLTAIVCAALEERQQKPRARLDRFIAPFRRAQRQALTGTKDFVIDTGRLNVADDKAFARDPVNLIRLFHLADLHSLALHPVAMRLVTQSLKLITAALRDNTEANRLFLEILTSRNAPETVLRRMNEAGVLGRFIPDFGKVVAMMQFNMYHRYTVDEHLLRSVGELADIDRNVGSNEHPLVNEIMPTIQNRTALYVATFLHDIAKGRPEDHSIAGARIARRLGPRLGLTPAETDTVSWLVEQHLVMSMTAQSRDLSDRKTIETFAGTVQTLERLKLLLILTVADIRAVGPGVWNGWKGQLLRSLFWETELVLAGGHSNADRRASVRHSQEELRAALTDWSPEEIEAYVGRHYPPYWLKVDLPTRLRHARFIRSVTARGESLGTEVDTDAFRGVTELTVLAPDHPRLLSVIAGACAAAGANIVDAQINTTTDGLALDTIFVSREFPEDADELRRAGRIAQGMEQALSGAIRLPEAVAKRGAGKTRHRAFQVAPDVVVDNEWSHRHTVVEVSGLDRPGLLYDLTTAISQLNLNIASAHIATFGEKAVDVFYVTDLTGAKITSPVRQHSIRDNLLAVFGKKEGKGK